MVEPMIPAAQTGGRSRKIDMREVFNAIRHIDRTGCQWRMLAKDFPPHTTVCRYFWHWPRRGVLDQIHQALLEKCRITCGREADPTAAIIDTQVAKATEKGGSPAIRSAYDAGKKTKGIKRNAIVDTEGHLLAIEVIAANTQDRDCAAKLIEKVLQKYPRLRKIFADGGYAGPKPAGALVGLPVDLEFVKRTDKDGGCKIIRRRRVIERTVSWLRCNRRLIAHYEALAMIAVGFIKLAMISVMLKRLTEARP